MEKLKELRKSAGKTQQDVATFLNCSYQCYAGYEKGRSEPDLKTLRKLGEFFGVSVDYLLGIETDAESDKKRLNEKLIELGLDGLGQVELLRKIQGLSKQQKDLIFQLVDNLKNETKH